MTYTATLYMGKKAIKEWNKAASGKRVEDRGSDEVMERVTAKFKNGAFVDLKLVNGDTPYIDPMLFDKAGNERALLDVGDEEDTYIMVVKPRGVTL